VKSPRGKSESPSEKRNRGYESDGNEGRKLDFPNLGEKDAQERVFKGRADEIYQGRHLLSYRAEKKKGELKEEQGKKKRDWEGFF